MEDDKLEQENIKTEKLNTNEESIASTTIPEDSSSSFIEKNKTNNGNTEQIEKDSSASGSYVNANIEDKKQNQESVETIEKKDIAEDLQNKDLKKDIPKQESKKYYFEDEILSDLIVRPPLETENTNIKDEVKFDKDSQTIESKTNSKTDENSEEKIKQDYPEKKSSKDPKENNSEKKENKESTNEASSKNTKEETEDLTYIEKLTLESKEKAVAEEEKICKKTDIDFWKFFVSDAVFLLICLFLTIVLIQKLLTSGEVAIVGTNQVHSSLESGEKTTIGNINILIRYLF